MNDAYAVAQLFRLAHYVRRKNHGLAFLPAFPDKLDIVRAVITSNPRVGSSKIITGGS